MKKQKKIIIGGIFFSLLMVLLNSVVAKADEYGLDLAAGVAELPKVSNLPAYIGGAIGVFLSIISAIFFVLTLYAGIRWMIEPGNEEEETKAKDTIIGATIGMVIVMASFALTNFIFKGTRGIPPEKSDLPSPAVPSVMYCLTEDAATNQLNCIAGGGSPCDGTSYPTLNECNAEIIYCVKVNYEGTVKVCVKRNGNEDFCSDKYPDDYGGLAACEADNPPPQPAP